MKKLFVAALLLCAGCASVHPGTEANVIGEHQLPLKVSGFSPDSGWDQPFQLVELTLENVSEDWVRINTSKIVIDNPAESKLSVVVGSDLKDWARAMEQKAKVDRHNKSILQTSILFAGSAATGSNDQSTSTVGALAVLGVYGWAASDVITNAQSMAQQVGGVPESHIYSKFSVPGKLFLRKWVLFNKPVKSSITNLVLQVETTEGKKETYEIKL